MTSPARPALAGVLLAAGLIAAPGAAWSVERPVAPSSAARPCPRQGPGFVEVPGTTTCIRIGGRVSAQYGTTRRAVSRDDIAGFGAGARVSAETRTDTSYGPVRTFFRVRGGSGPRD